MRVQMSATTAVDDGLDRGSDEHRDEKQDGYDHQWHVEGTQLIPWRPLGRILGDEVGVEPGDAALVILEEDKGGGAVYLAEVERLHFNKAQLEAFQGHDEGAVAWSADRVGEGTEEVSNFIGGGRRVTVLRYKPT